MSIVCSSYYRILEQYYHHRLQSKHPTMYKILQVAELACQAPVHEYLVSKNPTIKPSCWLVIHFYLEITFAVTISSFCAITALLYVSYYPPLSVLLRIISNTITKSIHYSFSAIICPISGKQTYAHQKKLHLFVTFVSVALHTSQKQKGILKYFSNSCVLN